MFTLVRHSMWTSEHFPRFRNGLEVFGVGPIGAKLVRELGGVIYDSLDSAWDGAEGFMYPSGITTELPAPQGTFVHTPFIRQPLFLPDLSRDLIAA